MRLVIVSYRLPFRVLRGRLSQNAGGLVSAVLAFANGTEGVASEVDEVVWIGASDHSAEELAMAKRTSQELKFRLIPVVLPEKLNQAFYGGFCNDLIWPLFHYFPSISSFEEPNWLAYQRATIFLPKRFETYICPEIASGFTIITSCCCPHWFVICCRLPISVFFSTFRFLPTK